MHYFYQKYGEILNEENSNKAKRILSDEKLYLDLNIDETGLTIAPGQDLEVSHRHMSPYMAIYPLGIVNVDDAKGKDIINKSIHWIEEKGTHNWCGYSFSWMGCLYAKAQEGNKAAIMLRDFATNFCSINSFHLNGDQKGGQYSSFTYRPFTLEGNFAFARGIQEMLIQSDHGYIEVFPAVPDNWLNVSFKTFRTEGAFLVSAEEENGNVSEIIINSKAGGKLMLKLPFKKWTVTGVKSDQVKMKNDIASVNMPKGSIVIFRSTKDQ